MSKRAKSSGLVLFTTAKPIGHFVHQISDGQNQSTSFPPGERILACKVMALGAT
jgi:hypothetical protein